MTARYGRPYGVKSAPLCIPPHKSNDKTGDGRCSTSSKSQALVWITQACAAYAYKAGVLRLCEHALVGYWRCGVCKPIPGPAQIFASAHLVCFLPIAASPPLFAILITTRYISHTSRAGHLVLRCTVWLGSEVVSTASDVVDGSKSTISGTN